MQLARQARHSIFSRTLLYIVIPIIVIGALLMSRGVVSTAASNPAQPYVLTFPEGSGNVVVIPSKNKVQFVVSLEGLADGEYEIALEGDSGQGAMFGAGNAHLQAGQLSGDTAIRPHVGNILMWAVHPERVVQQTSNPRVVVYQTGGERKAVASVALPK
ncbi:MAG TPA: hypothetical protein VFZ66_24065 [Herpetosiphonaceae bacterium]